MKVQSMKVQPLPNVLGEIMLQPVNTPPSPYEEPDGIVPPLTIALSIPPPLNKEQREDIPEIAEAIVLYGNSAIPRILTTYKITQAQLDAHVLTSPIYVAAAALTKVQLEEDPHLSLRLEAKKYLEINGLVTLNTVATSAEDPKDRINAIKLIADIADIGPRKQKADDGKGMAVNINFGNSLGLALTPKV
jgi:hypothetical protein